MQTALVMHGSALTLTFSDAPNLTVNLVEKAFELVIFLGANLRQVVSDCIGQQALLGSVSREAAVDPERCL